MSRIEKALEKAAQMRNGEAAATVNVVTDVTDKLHFAAASPRPVPGRTIRISRDNRLLAPIFEPQSAVSEQYRKLKSSLVRLTRADKFQNLLMVTSAIAGEGKTLTAVNLAISMAQEYDLTVLLVDADLRRPRVHSYLGFEQTIGLSDCLQDGIDIGEAIVKTDLDKLSVIPAGREVEKPLELLASKKMQELMAELKHRYNDRYVIVDTPPLLPFAETRALAHLVDGVIFVIHAEVTPAQSVLEARESLKGSQVLGVVLNDSTEPNTDNSHYSGYYGRQTAV
jgi:protein-tyrosine kinase